MSPGAPLSMGDAALERVAARHGATSAQVALAWSLRHSPVVIAIPGTTSIAHLEENAAAASLALTDEDMASLDAG
jgi:aryl-alcohol dehydrogenase-like predicted oxidoreductase